MTVNGCLRAGEAEDTFVLTVAQPSAADTPATYQLVGANTATLRGHIGERVEVSGVMTAQEQIASRAVSPANPKATGTSGTPSVETQTVVNIKKLDVSAVKPLGDRCEK